jgi:hypothetical protein
MARMRKPVKNDKILLVILKKNRGDVFVIWASKKKPLG